MRLFAMVTTKASKDYTGYALKSFFQHTFLRSYDHVVLIDNDKSFSLEECAAIVPLQNQNNFEYVANETPKSFSQNVNFALSHAAPHAADLFFLNNDLIFTPGWLDSLVVSERALLSPLSNRERQHEFNDFKWGNHLYLDDYLSRQSDLTQIVHQHASELFGYQTVLSLPFFCIKLPYIVYSELGLFDERFSPGGAEDNDYCLRAAEAGIPVKYALSSYILHFSGKSTWDGAESKSAAKQRRETFTHKFREKWGTILTRLLIDEDNSVIDAIPHAIKIDMARDDYRSFLQFCASEKK